MKKGYAIYIETLPQGEDDWDMADVEPVNFCFEKEQAAAIKESVQMNLTGTSRVVVKREFPL